MKKTLLIALTLFGISNTASAQSAADIKNAIDQQASQAMVTLTAVGADIKAGNEKFACKQAGSVETTLTFVTLMIFQAMQSGMMDQQTIQKYQGMAMTITTLKNGGDTFCKINNATDTDRRTFLSSINMTGNAIATATGKSWTDISL